MACTHMYICARCRKKRKKNKKKNKSKSRRHNESNISKKQKQDGLSSADKMVSPTRRATRDDPALKPATARPLPNLGVLMTNSHPHPL